MRNPVAILTPSVELHKAQGCPLCNEPQNDEGGFSETAIIHCLNLLARSGALLKILMDDGEIAWQEPESFYREHPEFKGKGDAK